MADDTGRIDGHETAVAHLDRHGLAAVEARRVDTDGLARKEPGHRGRLEAALGEPLLLAADGDAVLGR